MNRRSFLKTATLLGVAAPIVRPRLQVEAGFSPSWIVGIGNSITRGYRAYHLRGYVSMVSAQLAIPVVNKAVGGALNHTLWVQSVKAKRWLDYSLISGPGLVLCATGIKELHLAPPSEFDATLAYILANTQAIAHWWAGMFPGTRTVVLPPVENHSDYQGMSNAVRDAFIVALHDPAIALNWYPEDGLHDYLKLDTWWDGHEHPNTAGHTAMAQAVMDYL